jgi:hypothetical protein
MYLPIGFSSEYPLLHSSPHRQSRKISTPSGESLQIKISRTENLVMLTKKKKPWSNFIYLFIYYLIPIGRYVSVTTLFLMSRHVTYQASCFV